MARIGSKRHRVTLERLADAENAFGEAAQVWAAVGLEVWAEVKTLAGRELETALQVRAGTSCRVEVRAGELDRPTAADRINFGGRILQILAATDPEERGRDLVLDCAEWPGAHRG